MRQLSPGLAKAPKSIRDSFRGRWQVRWSHVSEHAQDVNDDKEYLPICRRGLEDTYLVVLSGFEWRREAEGHLLFNLLILGMHGWSSVTDLQVSCRLELVFSAIGPTEMKLRADLDLCWNDCVFPLATATDFGKGWECMWAKGSNVWT